MASLWLLAAMAFITYVLLAGMALGIQKRSVPTRPDSRHFPTPDSSPHLPGGSVPAPKSVRAPSLTPAPGRLVRDSLHPPPLHGRRFSPEVLGLCASTALVWVVMEVLALLLGVYLATVRSDLSTFHLLAYSGYKYVG